MLRTDQANYRRSADVDLLHGLRRRDPLALAEAYHRTVTAAHACARRLLRSSQATEALLGAVYSELWEHPPGSDASVGLEGWVRQRSFTIAAAHLRERGTPPAAASLHALLPDLPAPDTRYLDQAERTLAALDEPARLAVMRAHDAGQPTHEQGDPQAHTGLERGLRQLAGPDAEDEPGQGCADVGSLADWELGLVPAEQAARMAAAVTERPECAARIRVLRRGRRRLEGLPPTPDMGQRVLVSILVGRTAGPTWSAPGPTAPTSRGTPATPSSPPPTPSSPPPTPSSPPPTPSSPPPPPTPTPSSPPPTPSSPPPTPSSPPPTPTPSSPPPTPSSPPPPPTPSSPPPPPTPTPSDEPAPVAATRPTPAPRAVPPLEPTGPLPVASDEPPGASRQPSQPYADLESLRHDGAPPPVVEGRDPATSVLDDESDVDGLPGRRRLGPPAAGQRDPEPDDSVLVWDDDEFDEGERFGVTDEAAFDEEGPRPPPSTGGRVLRGVGFLVLLALGAVVGLYVGSAFVDVFIGT